MKKALITGITGQDGSYLSELLLEKGYEVHGIVRRSSSFNTQRLDDIYRDPHESGVHFFMHYGDLSDTSSLANLIRELQPDEVYHLGAQSHVKVSFRDPRVHVGRDGHGNGPAPRSDPLIGGRHALLPSVVVGDVRIGPSPAERGDPVPSS